LNKDIYPVPGLPEKLPKDWKRVRNKLMENLGGTPELAPWFQDRTGLTVTLTCQMEKDSKKWIHCSISRPNRIPSYNELCRVKELFLGKDSLALMLFVPEAEHVNIHDFCLHLWVCLDGRPTPDFRVDGIHSI
jgi:hypothetical protein